MAERNKYLHLSNKELEEKCAQLGFKTISVNDNNRVFVSENLSFISDSEEEISSDAMEAESSEKIIYKILASAPKGQVRLPTKEDVKATEGPEEEKVNAKSPAKAVEAKSGKTKNSFRGKSKAKTSNKNGNENKENIPLGAKSAPNVNGRGGKNRNSRKPFSDVQNNMQNTKAKKPDVVQHPNGKKGKGISNVKDVKKTETVEETKVKMEGEKLQTLERADLIVLSYPPAMEYRVVREKFPGIGKNQNNANVTTTTISQSLEREELHINPPLWREFCGTCKCFKSQSDLHTKEPESQTSLPLLVLGICFVYITSVLYAFYM